MAKELSLATDATTSYSRIGESIALECGHIYFNSVLKMKRCTWVDGASSRYIDI